MLTVNDVAERLVSGIDKLCEMMSEEERAEFLAIVWEDVGERAQAAYDNLPCEEEEERDPDPDEGTIADRSRKLIDPADGKWVNWR